MEEQNSFMAGSDSDLDQLRTAETHVKEIIANAGISAGGPIKVTLNGDQKEWQHRGTFKDVSNFSLNIDNYNGLGVSAQLACINVSSVSI